MTPDAPELIASWILLLCAVSVGGLAIFLIKWMAKTAALYSMHTARERLYDIALLHPAARSTALYRNVELIISGTIGITRDRGHAETVSLWIRFESAIRKAREKHADQPKSGRRDRQEFLDVLGEDGGAMLEELRAALGHTRRALSVAALGGNFLFSLAAMILAAPLMAFSALSSSFDPVDDTVVVARMGGALFPPSDDIPSSGAHCPSVA